MSTRDMLRLLFQLRLSDECGESCGATSYSSQSAFEVNSRTTLWYVRGRGEGHPRRVGRPVKGAHESKKILSKACKADWAMGSWMLFPSSQAGILRREACSAEHPGCKPQTHRKPQTPNPKP